MSETVDMAHSEVRSLVTKAARGAGMSWGMAEEAGWAADWLARREMPAAEWATLWLAKVLEGRLNVVEAGVMFADQRAAEGEPFDFAPLSDDLFAPGFILPFIHLVAMRYGAVEIASTSGRAAAGSDSARHATQAARAAEHQDQVQDQAAIISRPCRAAAHRTQHRARTCPCWRHQSMCSRTSRSLANSRPQTGHGHVLRGARGVAVKCARSPK